MWSWRLLILGSLLLQALLFDSGKTFRLISWQKNLLPPGGDFSSPNTRSYHRIFRVRGCRVHQFCGYMKLGHSQYTALTESYFPPPQDDAEGLQHKISKLHLMTGLKSHIMSWKWKKLLFPVSHAQCVWHCTAHCECCKKSIILSLFKVKKFQLAGLVIGVHPKIYPAYFLNGIW